MKNINLIYAATDAASNFARASNQISLILSKYLDKGEGRYTEEKAIEEIKKEIRFCAEWAEETFDAILINGINP
jgi:hypothetical protein